MEQDLHEIKENEPLQQQLRLAVGIGWGQRLVLFQITLDSPERDIKAFEEIPRERLFVKRLRPGAHPCGAVGRVLRPVERGEIRAGLKNT